MMPQTITNNAQIAYQYDALSQNVSLKTQTNYVTTNIVQNCVNILVTSNKNHYAPNDTIIYNIFVTNNSNSTIYNVEILENLSDFTKYLANTSTITLSNGTTCTIFEAETNENAEAPAVGYIVGGNTNISTNFGYKINDINANDTILVSFSVKIDDVENLPDIINNSATLFYTTSPENSLKISVQSNVNTINKAYALLNVTKSVDKLTAIVGDSLTYIIKFNNIGNINAQNVHVIDNLPQSFETKSVSLTIADLPYEIDYHVDENNVLNVPANPAEPGFCIPANSDDSFLTITGTIV